MKLNYSNDILMHVHRFQSMKVSNFHAIYPFLIYSMTVKFHDTTQICNNEVLFISHPPLPPPKKKMTDTVIKNP